MLDKTGERVIMNQSMAKQNHIFNDLAELQRVIQQLAQFCQLDLNNELAVRRFREGDFSLAQDSNRNFSICQELRTMLTLQLRLEASSSEDIGIDGLNFLWNQCSNILKRFTLGDPVQCLVNPKLSQC
jgi:hypothetical protein